MEYGIMIEHDIENTSAHKQHIYNIFSHYFNNPLMYKYKNTADFSVYCSNVHCMISNTKRYIVAVTKQDNNEINNTVRLKDVKWINIQTRALENGPELPSTHTYIPTLKTPLAEDISRITTSLKRSEYKCDKLNLKIELLNTDNTTMGYRQTGKLVNAVETFETIISFL